MAKDQDAPTPSTPPVGRRRLRRGVVPFVFATLLVWWLWSGVPTPLDWNATLDFLGVHDRVRYVLLVKFGAGLIALLALVRILRDGGQPTP